ncbi:MAG: hypothetical protein K2N72_00625 [Oscillospiraceae bacterium]|nr:hypothetical protein [Oscillospiraceae bacterium]
MNIKGKIFGILALAMLLSLTACGEPAEEPTKSTEAAETVQGSNEDDPSTEDSAVSDVSDNALRQADEIERQLRQEEERAKQRQTTAESGDKIINASLDEVIAMFDRGEDSVIVKSTAEAEPEEIGLTFAMYYSTEAGDFFGWGGHNNWKYDYDEAANGYMGEGIYIDWEAKEYAPMDFETAKEFMKRVIGLTDRGFGELCEYSPTAYYDFEGRLGIMPGDGGGAGWDYNHITGCTREGDVVTFECERVGLKENWGYEEDMTVPFTFRVALEDDIWKLDGVSDGEYFFGSEWVALVSFTGE